jgi:alkanesulfonate monooxygenase SsuD/methylene tetrahydromethanopterin reductase-like flavin-dependent oxidoreductase (luciferase family)
MDIMSDGVQRVQRRLERLLPPPLRPIPTLIGGSGEQRTQPLVRRYADIWHSFLDIDTVKCKNDLVKQHAAQAGRAESLTERAVTWPGVKDAELYYAEGATLFTTENQADR